MKLHGKRILITGASFIGIHLIPRLLEEQVHSIRVVNKSNRHKKNLEQYMSDIEFFSRDLRDLNNAKKSVKNIDIVFHLSADHGGRGYVDLFQGNTAANFLLDGSVFYAALQENVEHVFYASSGCVYPNYLQSDLKKKVYLKESDVKAPYDADNMYGWAKLMGEFTLKTYFQDFGMKSSIGRLFTVYGPYASESHAVMGTIAKAYIQQDPFEIWGDGKQIRNWTYVKDIVEGILLTVKHINDASPINLGTQEQITVNEMVGYILKEMKFLPKEIRHVKMPIGPVNRVANNKKAAELFQWKPRYNFKDALSETIEWYVKNKDKMFVSNKIQQLLLQG